MQAFRLTFGLVVVVLSHTLAAHGARAQVPVARPAPPLQFWQASWATTVFFAPHKSNRLAGPRFISLPPASRETAQRAALTAVPQAKSAAPGTETGIASFYWQDQMTSSGERFDKTAMTAAHRTLPLGTRVRVTHVTTGHSVIVRINDRGPFKAGRIIDLSEAAADVIGMRGAGLAPVRVDVVAGELAR